MANSDECCVWDSIDVITSYIVGYHLMNLSIHLFPVIGDSEILGS
jgi:hypothetical protein